MDKKIKGSKSSLMKGMNPRKIHPTTASTSHSIGHPSDTSDYYHESAVLDKQGMTVDASTDEEGLLLLQCSRIRGGGLLYSESGLLDPKFIHESGSVGKLFVISPN